MSLFARLAEKSWETPAAGTSRPKPIVRPRRRSCWSSISAVAAVLFGLVTSAYLMRMGMPGMAHGPMGGWRPLPEPPLLWVNTGILFLASLAWEGARIVRARPPAGRVGPRGRTARAAVPRRPVAAVGPVSWRPAMACAAIPPPPSSI